MCGIAGLISHNRQKENGDRIKKSIVLQNDRGNGLGAGFAAYGIFPEHKDLYTFHVMGESTFALNEVLQFLKENFWVAHTEEILIWDKIINDHPLCATFCSQK